MNLGERIKLRREQLGMSQEELAQKLGYKSRSTIARIESGENDLNQTKIKSFAEALNTVPGYFLDWEDPIDYTKLDNYVPISKKKVPLIGEIAAGEPIYADQEIEEYLPCSKEIQADLALRIKGDSMINAGIKDGDIVYIKAQDDVENGEIAAVIVDDSATLKRVYKGKDFLQLVAENPKYAPMVFDDGNCSTVKILGKAVAVLNKL
jgi:repressor LexA